MSKERTVQGAKYGVAFTALGAIVAGTVFGMVKLKESDAVAAPLSMPIITGALPAKGVNCKTVPDMFKTKSLWKVQGSNTSVSETDLTAANKVFQQTERTTCAGVQAIGQIVLTQYQAQTNPVTAKKPKSGVTAQGFKSGDSFVISLQADMPDATAATDYRRTYDVMFAADNAGKPDLTKLQKVDLTQFSKTGPVLEYVFTAPDNPGIQTWTSTQIKTNTDGSTATLTMGDTVNPMPNPSGPQAIVNDQQTVGVINASNTFLKPII